MQIVHQLTCLSLYLQYFERNGEYLYTVLKFLKYWFIISKTPFLCVLNLINIFINLSIDINSPWKFAFRLSSPFLIPLILLIIVLFYSCKFSFWFFFFWLELLLANGVVLCWLIETFKLKVQEVLLIFLKNSYGSKLIANRSIQYF